MSDETYEELEGLTMTLDIVGCARCWGEGHKGLTFVALTHPLNSGSEIFTHWCPCPTNGEPIMLTITDKP